MNGWRRWIERRATPATVVLAVTVYVLSVVLLSVSDARIAAFAPDVTKPDLRFGYDHEELMQVLDAFGAGGRRAYAWNLLIDSVMPVLFAATTLLVAARALPRWLAALGLAPVTFAVLDLIENAAFGVMLGQFPGVSGAFVAIVRWVTMVKLSAFYIAFPTLILGCLLLIAQWIRRRRTPRAA